MAEPAPEPSQFDQWERAAKMQLALLTTLADVDKKEAEARFQDAKTRNLEEATIAASIANDQLQYTIHQLRVQDYNTRQELKTLQKYVTGLGLLKNGQQLSPATCTGMWQAFFWFTSHTLPTSSWSDEWMQVLDESEINPSNYYPSTQKQPKPIETNAPVTLGMMCAWMARSFVTPGRTGQHRPRRTNAGDASSRHERTRSP